MWVICTYCDISLDHMEVYSTEIPSIYQTIDVNMNPIFKHDELEFYWNYYENKRAYSFKVTLNDREVYEGFKELLTKSIFEVASKSRFSRYRVNTGEKISDQETSS